MVNDADYMARALVHAERGRGRTSPNPIVGAVVVAADGVVVATGYHERAGEAHAEVRALEAAGPRARGATLYCTLEPCCHVGMTGPCTTRIADAGIRRVVSAVRDPNPKVAGGGVAELRSRGIDVVEGVLEEAAARANGAFFTWVRKRRPQVTMKIALSCDGYVARQRGQRTRITGAAVARRTHRDRAAIDAVAVGVGTVLCDDPLLTARTAWRERPLTRVIFDRRLRTPPGARLLTTLDSGPVLIMCPDDAALEPRAALLRSAGARIEPIRGEFLPEALSRLAELKVTSLILEGGPTLHEAFCRARLVDRVQIYVGDRALWQDPALWRDPSGSSPVPWIDAQTLPWTALAGPRVRILGDDVCIEADLDESANVHGIDRSGR
ncbi:MAG TPA: bifunctional diaminohydroxyphosphoribosylaminopyrimidine deaminase/5-amino-6-(5-phosphoribosylamino)uracil reductase RibD [Vicinamibacterales bacterium]|nr:bifunctional diaminohydroxyphosphoribosylaminopyrimidine deaminase/5-amino-6-(5-phosphoribosylamino)uracil reductase RibD [Vicinamibacterales bacterium]